MPSGTVLVVDDDEAYLWYVDAALKTAGLVPVLCPSAYTATKALAEGRFDVVLSDLKLPGGSGLEVLESARRSDPLCVGIIMTAFATLEAGLSAMDAGVYDFLAKPCPAEVLVGSVRRALEHHGLKKELARRAEGFAAVRREFAEAVASLVDVSTRLERLPGAPGELAELARKAGALRESSLLLKARLDGLG